MGYNNKMHTFFQKLFWILLECPGKEKDRIQCRGKIIFSTKCMFTNNSLLDLFWLMRLFLKIQALGNISIPVSSKYAVSLCLSSAPVVSKLQSFWPPYRAPLICTKVFCPPFLTPLQLLLVCLEPKLESKYFTPNPFICPLTRAILQNFPNNAALSKAHPVLFFFFQFFKFWSFFRWAFYSCYSAHFCRTFTTYLVPKFLSSAVYQTYLRGYLRASQIYV